MFSFLDHIAGKSVISAVYYSVRLIGHRDRIDNVYDGFRIENLESEPTAEEQELAFSIIREIELSEGTILQNIEYSAAEDYIFQLLQVVQKRAASEFGYDAEKGRKLLGEFQPAVAAIGQNTN